MVLGNEGAGAPLIGGKPVDQVDDVRRVEQRFRRHTTAQDAQAADLLAAFDHDRIQASAGSGARRRIPAAAAADDGDIEIEALHAGEDGARPVVVK